MQPPSRVFVVADNDANARKLSKVFTANPDFFVVGAGAFASLTRLPAKIDVVLVRVNDRKQMSSLPRIAVPTVYLTGQGDVPPSSNTHTMLSLDASPIQIRAATLALATGLWVSKDLKGEPPNNADSKVAFEEPLTDRELQVLNLIADGLSNPEIARELRISRNTVKFHVSSIIGKLGAASRTETVTLGLKRGLIIL